MPGTRPARPSAPGRRVPATTAPVLPSTPDPDSRVEKFLQAAIEVFLEKGYRNAHLSDIVTRSGGSLTTLYQAYGSKKGLVRAIMERCIGGFAQTMDALHDSPLPPEQALPIAAEGMLEEILSPRHIVTHRIVVAEGVSFPDLRDWYFEHGVAPPNLRMADYFARQMQAGHLHLDSPRVVANRFHMMVFGDAIIRSTAGVLDTGDLAWIKADTREAVAIFVRGMQPGGARAGADTGNST